MSHHPITSSQEWESASAIMKAFNVGKHESLAIANLQNRMPAVASSALKSAVRVRGMRSFVLHETIGRDLFNSAYTSGTGQFEQWAVQLTNTESNELAPYFLIEVVCFSVCGLVFVELRNLSLSLCG